MVGPIVIERRRRDMRHIVGTLVLVGALVVAGGAFAAVPQSASSSAKKTATPASHTVKGTVKSLDNSTLVLSPKKGSEMTFVVDNNTAKQGAPAVGSEVSVKYHTEGKTMMATAITAQPAKQVASSKPAASKKK
jgi:hypothetical protein